MITTKICDDTRVSFGALRVIMDHWGKLEINSLAPVRCGNNFKGVIFKLIQNSSLSTCVNFPSNFDQHIT